MLSNYQNNYVERSNQDIKIFATFFYNIAHYF